jgi:hypothetical protein
MFLRNVGIYLQVYTALRPRRAASTFVYTFPYLFLRTMYICLRWLIHRLFNDTVSAQYIT